MKAIVLKPGQKPETIELNGADANEQVKELQALVGGYIECAMQFQLGDGRRNAVVYCNEEGLLQNLPHNVYRPTDGHPLVGNLVAVVVDQQGEQVDYTKDELGYITLVMSALRAIAS